MQSISAQNVVDLLLDAVCVVDADSRVVFVSPAFERIFGYTPEEAVGMRMLDLVHPGDLSATEQQVQRVMSGSPQLQFENRYVRKDGAIVDILWTARWLPDRQLRVAVAHDITQRKRTESMHAAMYAISAAAHTAAGLPELLEQIHHIIADRIAHVAFSVALRDQHGTVGVRYRAAPGSVEQASPIHRHEEAWCAEVMRQGTSMRRTLQGSPTDLRTDPEALYWLGVPLPATDQPLGALMLHGRVGRDNQSEQARELLEFVAAQVAMVIERTQMHERLRHMAQYDQLTRLPNRALFYDRLQIAVARARREQTQLALLFIDLDRFKEVNDTLGHTMGDRLLQGVAQRLQDCVRGSDTVARLGGDEFVVLLEGMPCGESPEPMAQKMLTAFSQPFELERTTLHIQPSIGIALYPDHGTHESVLLSRADEAMYTAKRGGGNRSFLYPGGLGGQCDAPPLN